MSPLIQKNMSTILLLIKIALFTFCYALCYYFIPLPPLALLGFLFPLVYLYEDMQKVKYIQTQLILGFGGGIVLAIILIQLSVISLYFSFMAMSLFFCLCFYFSCAASWMKLPLMLFSVIASMTFNLVMGGAISSTSLIFGKFILGISLSVLLYGIIDILLGQSQHRYFSKHFFNQAPLLYKKVAQHFILINWSYVRHTLCVYMALLCLLLVQYRFDLASSLCAIAAASIIVVLGSDHELTKINILLRTLGALLGILIALLQLLVITALPFFFMQLGLLVLVMLFFAYLIKL